MLQEKRVFTFVFKREKFSKSKLKAYLSILVNLSEKFMIVQQYEHDELKNKIVLLRALNLKNLKSSFRNEAKDFNKKFSGNELKYDFNYYSALAEYKSTLSDYYFRVDFDKYLTYENEHSKSKFLEFQNIFWNFMNSINLDYPSHLDKIKDQFNLLEYLSGYVEEKLVLEYKNENQLQISYFGFMMKYRKDGDKYYYKLKEFLFKDAKKMPGLFLRNTSVMLMNFCSNRLYEKFWYHQFFEIVKFRIKNEALLFDGYIEPSEFFMITRIAFRLEELKWAGDFIEKYKDKILPDRKDRNTLLFLTMAYFHFYNRQYNEVITAISKLDYLTPFTYMDSKILLAQTYFELEYYESIYPLIDTIKHYIKRNKPSMHVKSVPYYDNTIFLVEEFLKFVNGKKVNRNKMYDKIHSDVVFSKEWFLKKLKDMDRKHVK